MAYANFEAQGPVSHQSAPAMRTVLSEFCGAFQQHFAPLVDPVDVAAEALARAPDDLGARSVLPALRDARHQMQALTDKVAEQQAYVLIFGPLKSGKSTFMNALSAAYVSEVTSQPAYPCMVYVRHSDTPGFVVTHYDGRAQSYADRNALRELVETGHHDLTERIREIEAGGGVFDPATHMPEAIRRIDVHVPIDDLAESGAVLVDTPGLYTRMKFGYERMTRDFRNAAACAIFIVKTDNLFLEQVFDEFGELLELFSRIFLIVNVDSTKNDLQPDGTLAPSLEQKSPWEVVQAFEDLSMTGPLKKAFEEGRLEIYPVDLLRAASRRILARNGRAGADTQSIGGQAEFDDILGDLTEFLNSNDYLKAFVDDSLRRAATLVDELAAACRDSSVQQLAQSVDVLRRERDAARAEAVVFDRLRQTAWRANTERLLPGLGDRVEHAAGAILAETTQAATTGIAQWFETSDSLYHLVEGHLVPAFDAARERLEVSVRVLLEQRAADDLTSVAGDLDTLTDLTAVGVDIRARIADALAGLPQAAATGSRPVMPAEDLPVRRGLLDWLLLRSGARMRRRLFGPAAYRNSEIAPAVKTRRLGEPAAAVIRERFEAQLKDLLEHTARELPAQLLGEFAVALDRDLAERLEAAHDDTKQRLREADGRLRRIQRAHDSLDALGDRLAAFRPALDELVGPFGQSERAALVRDAG